MNMASSVSGYKHIVLTGSPGVGKTTLIRKTCEALRAKGFPVKGFYTEECRENGTRVGFDVVTLDGQRSPLARIGVLLPVYVKPSGYLCQPDSTQVCDDLLSMMKPDELIVVSKVLAIDSFVFDQASGAASTSVYVVDEIGKMELFSSQFKKVISEMLKNRSICLLATIPVASANPIPLVEEIRRHPAVHLFEITRGNRDGILDEIIETVISARQHTAM